MRGKSICAIGVLLPLGRILLLRVETVNMHSVASSVARIAATISAISPAKRPAEATLYGIPEYGFGYSSFRQPRRTASPTTAASM